MESYETNTHIIRVKYMYSHMYCINLTGQLSGGRGRLPCPICRRQAIIPEEGFPVCFISDYIREQINKQDSRVDGRLLEVGHLQIIIYTFISLA